MCALSACLVPPDGDPPIDVLNDPPIVDLDTVAPSQPILRIIVPPSLERACNVRFSARVSDSDDGVLRVRWVADNRTSLVRLIEGDDDVLVPEGVRVFSRSIDVRALTPPLVGVAHTVSLFVSDAPGGWYAPEEEIQEGTTKTDFGRLAPSDGGTAGGTVVEVRWFLGFELGGECVPP